MPDIHIAFDIWVLIVPVLFHALGLVYVVDTIMNGRTSQGTIAWAMALLRGTFDDLAAEQSAAGREAVFEELRPRLVGDGEQRPIAESAARLNMSESNVKVSLHRLRRRFGERVRARVAETVDNEAEVDEELRALMTCFGDGP